MEVVTKPAFRVIGLPIAAGWEQLWTEMPRAWRLFFRRRSEIPDRVTDVSLDITRGRANGLYSQLICAEVTALDVVPDGMVGLEVPEHRYVHYRHTGSLPAIAASFGAMYDWAKAQELPTDEFKLDRGYTAPGTESAHDLYVRVAT